VITGLLIFLAVAVGYVLLMRVVLPALGVPTWMSGQCELRGAKLEKNSDAKVEV